jgi:hypothetical protein
MPRPLQLHTGPPGLVVLETEIRSQTCSKLCSFSDAVAPGKQISSYLWLVSSTCGWNSLLKEYYKQTIILSITRAILEKCMRVLKQPHEEWKST